MSEEFDSKYFENYSASLIRSLRGQRKQKDLNSGLGVEYNLISMWENKKKKIALDDFVNYLEVLVPNLSLNFLYDQMGTKNSYQFFNKIIQSKDLKLVLETLEVSRPTLKRWQKEESAPTLDQFLHLLYLKGRIDDFLQKLHKIIDFDQLKEFGFLQRSSTTIHYKYPWAIFLKHYIIALTAREKLYKVGDIAASLNVPLKEEQEVLNEFKKLGLIHLDKKIAYAHLNTEVNFDYRSSSKDELRLNKSLKKYFMEFILNLLKSEENEGETLPLDIPPHLTLGIFSLNLTDEELKELNDKISTLFNDLFQYGKRPKGKEGKHARIFQIQILDY